MTIQWTDSSFFAGGMMETAQLLLGQSGHRPRLFVKNGSDVEGPFPFATALRMIRDGRVRADQPVSADRVHWTEAARVRELYRMEREGTLLASDSTQHFVAQERARLESHLVDPGVPAGLFHPMALTAAGMGLFYGLMQGAASILGAGLSAPHSVQALWVSCIIPAALLSWGTINSLGGSLLNYIYRLTPSERRFLALHASASAFLRLKSKRRAVLNWLTRGEWGVRPLAESPLGYVHVFRIGEPLRKTEDEVALWEELGRILPPRMRSLCHPGHAVRDLQDVRSLPSWTRMLNGPTDGAELGRLLNAPYHVWAEKFLRRARRRMGLELTAEVEFILTCTQRISGEETLVAAVFPSGYAEMSDSAEAPSAAA